MQLLIERYGRVDYHRAREMQRDRLERLRRQRTGPCYCLLLEHPPVYTLGRHGSLANLGVGPDRLAAAGIEVVRVERGGEITYHGPGQLVCYPILPLKACGLTVADYISRLEQLMLDTAVTFGITAARDSRNHGIWVGNNKLGSVGIAIRHGISYHGLALNVDLDLEPFSWINPCGLPRIGMTSLARERGVAIATTAVRETMTRMLGEVLGFAEVEISEPELEQTLPDRSARRPKPAWLRKKLPTGPDYERTRRLVSGCSLHTVCQEARCPNQFECYGKGTATFMIMGDTCTRNCRFCAVAGGIPESLDATEPARVAQAVVELGLDYVVLTSVTRDDLPDGGAAHFSAVVEALRQRCPGVPVEVLIPDFGGDPKAVQTVCNGGPVVVNHNLETVPRLYPQVRPQADYRRSLELLQQVKRLKPEILTKSGIMTGLGETGEELEQVMTDLRGVGCELLTLGQYLQPTTAHLPVRRFLPPEEFEWLRERALQLGFLGVAAGPHVRSSYRAGQLYRHAAAS